MSSRFPILFEGSITLEDITSALIERGIRVHSSCDGLMVADKLSPAQVRARTEALRLWPRRPGIRKVG